MRVCASALELDGGKKKARAGSAARLRRLTLAASEATTHIESLVFVSQEKRTRPRHHDDGATTMVLALVSTQQPHWLKGGAAASER